MEDVAQATPPPAVSVRRRWRLAELIPVDYNPRTIDERQAGELRESITGFGLVQPIVVNTFPGREGRIVGGEQRFHQLGAIGAEEVPDAPDGSRGTIEVYLPEDKERELNIRLNRNTGGWDMEKLRTEFEVPTLVDWGFERYEFPVVDLPKAVLPLEGGGTPSNRPAAPAAAAAPYSPVRMVQLFFDQQTHEEFEALVDRASNAFGTENPTDTVLAALRGIVAVLDANEGTASTGDDVGVEEPAEDLALDLTP